MINKRTLMSFCAKPLNYVNRLIKKDEKRILIYSNLGFRDNAKAMFDYLIDNGYNETYKIVCSLSDYRKYNTTKIKNVKYVSAFSGVKYFFRSKFMFYSFGKYLIKPSSTQRVVNLWHGMPLKAIGNLVKGCEDIDYNYFTYMISTSPFFNVVLSKAFKCSEEQLILTGQPRCDKLYSNNSITSRTIVWFPTFRSSNALGATDLSTEFSLITSVSEWEQLDMLLDKASIKLIIKPHPLDDSAIKIPDLACVSLLSHAELVNSGCDIYDLLKTSIGLITDFSSIYFDYLPLNRPIGFTVDSMEEYSNNRGFVIDNPEIIMPGQRISTFNHLLDFINNIVDNKDTYKTRREEVNRLVNSSIKPNSCEHILDFIELKK